MTDNIREILKGIDKDETESGDGWWETSCGVAFGTNKLREVEKYVEALLARNVKLEAVLEAAKKHAAALNADQCWGESGWSIIELDAAIAVVQTQGENDD